MHMFQCIHPLVSHIMQLIITLIETPQFQKNKPQFICHSLIHGILAQSIRRKITVIRPSLQMRHTEIQDSYENYRLEIEVPFKILCTSLFTSDHIGTAHFHISFKCRPSLFHKRIARIIQSSFLKILLLGALHFNNKFRTILTPTENIKNGFSIR